MWLPSIFFFIFFLHKIKKSPISWVITYSTPKAIPVYRNIASYNTCRLLRSSIAIYVTDVINIIINNNYYYYTCLKILIYCLITCTSLDCRHLRAAGTLFVKLIACDINNNIICVIVKRTCTLVHPSVSQKLLSSQVCLLSTKISRSLKRSNNF